ncbi:MAG: hypothetical protein KBD27_00280 [Candidatus Moranbacteria bacterium]|nr:hypothetical protein [Candidatus Moranbacteria bacterium]
MPKQKRQPRGSVLVFALLVLNMLLSLAISGAMTNIAAKSTARATEKSMFAFQVADGAAEAVLLRIYLSPSDANLHAMRAQLQDYVDPTGCDNGVISGVTESGYGTFSVAFLDNDGDPIDCSDVNWRSKLVYIVSTGSFAGTTRAIQLGITPP